jgi:FkbM family methyltransferase
MGRNEQARIIAAHFDIAGFIDDFTEEVEFLGKPIVQASEIDTDSMIVVCSTMRPISAQRMLEEKGFKDVLDYVPFFRWLNQPQFSLDIFQQFQIAYTENQSSFERIYERLLDELSRTTFRDLVDYRGSGDLSYMQRYSFDPVGQYFAEFIEYSADEVFVDAGGYDGQTAREFIRHCPRYKRIYFFEPAEENMRRAKENLKGFDNIIYFTKGMSNREGRVSFDADAGSASSISSSGEVEIEVDTLDRLVDEPVTFIKMDIEGAEAEAIEGCRGHIARDHPKLAIAVYHKVNDFWGLPEMILSIRDDYELYIRHYTEGADETVMYFMPIS